MESGQTHAHPSSFIRSRSPHTLSRKRARIDELDEVIQELQSPSQSDEDLVRDDIYYFSDGSCILRVENTLFNVCLCCYSLVNAFNHAVHRSTEP